jgi:hypothetical protein
MGNTRPLSTAVRGCAYVSLQECGGLKYVFKGQQKALDPFRGRGFAYMSWQKGGGMEPLGLTSKKLGGLFLSCSMVRRKEEVRKYSIKNPSWFCYILPDLIVASRNPLSFSLHSVLPNATLKAVLIPMFLGLLDQDPDKS